MSRSVRIPLLFVLLWSSSYIAFAFCSDHIEPATFIVIRASMTALLLYLIVVVIKSKWPQRRIDIFYSIVVGVLIHGVYAGGSFASIYHGLDVTICALILSLQPLLTILLSSTFLGERITSLKIAGILAGLIGVSMIIMDGQAVPAIWADDAAVMKNDSVLAVALCFMALLAISGATIIQKRFCTHTELLPGACIQYAAAALFALPVAFFLETMHVDWNPDLFLGMSWLVIVISVGAVSLLMMLINRGDAGSVANLFYLVTPLVAIQAWLFFDEKLSASGLLGMVLCLLGVVVVGFVTTTKQTAEMVDTAGRTEVRSFK
ncbi:MAG: DMT family transporter [Granulosicoccus sp.]|nr:DMT family transporter [Granulosicoccus sp.]